MVGDMDRDAGAIVSAAAMQTMRGGAHVTLSCQMSVPEFEDNAQYVGIVEVHENRAAKPTGRNVLSTFQGLGLTYTGSVETVSKSGNQERKPALSATTLSSRPASRARVGAAAVAPDAFGLLLVCPFAWKAAAARAHTCLTS